jgi:uncharacterized membrane protein
MTRNESSIDRLVRLVLGVALLALGFWSLSLNALGIVAAVVGGILLLTAATGFCPLYRLFGVKTCRSC